MAYGAILGQSFETSPVLDNYFTKDETLTSSTAALFGLGADSVPDDVLAYLGKYAPKIATGSYVGTGTAGSSNPNSLTFDFIPKVLIVQAYDWSSFNAGSDDFLNFAIMVNGISLYMGVQSDSNVSSKSVSVTWSGNTVSWYSTTSNAMSQLNGGSEKYFYVAIG